MMPLIEASELAPLLAQSDTARAAVPLVLDVRWTLGGPDSRTEYERGHIPGAVFVDLESELAGVPEAESGRHPLPSIESFREATARWGLTAGRAVVVYDDNGGMSAARAWWLLRYAGHPSVRVLNGGLTAWQRGGGALESGSPAPATGAEGATAYLGFGFCLVLDADSAAALAASEEGVLLDARAAERYRGEIEPIDPRAGHIPGALSAPTSANLDAEGRMLPAGELRTRFAALGVKPGTRVGAYCGSGITAAHEALALAVAGIEAAVYPGSWSQWSNLPDRPVATG